MAQVTIYVPDDVVEAVRARKEALNVSAVCTQALRVELGRLQGMEVGQVLHNTEGGETHQRGSRLVSFQDAFGKEVLINPDHVTAVGTYGGNTGIYFAARVRNNVPDDQANVIVVRGSVAAVKQKLGAG